MKGGMVYQKNDAPWPIDALVDYPIKNRGDLKNYHVPDAILPGQDSGIKAVVEMYSDDITILGAVNDPLTTAWLIVGYEKICYILYDDPELIKEVLKISNKYFKEAARRSVESGCIGSWVREDLGDSDRGFFSLDDFQKNFLPYLMEIVDNIDSLGVPILLHSCGHRTDYLDDLAQTKITAIHPLQCTTGMDLRKIEKQLGHRFRIIGNIGPTKTLPFGSPEEVAAEVNAAIENAAARVVICWLLVIPCTMEFPLKTLLRCFVSEENMVVRFRENKKFLRLNRKVNKILVDLINE